jgi:hypothetical protein
LGSVIVRRLPVSKMVAFVLHDPGMKTLRGAGDEASLGVEAAIADMGRPFDQPPQSRHRQAAFPAAFHARVDDLDLRIDQDGQGGRVVETLGLLDARVGPLIRCLEHHHPQGDMDLGRCEARAIGVDHGLDHVGHEPPDLGGGGVHHRFRLAREHRMAHSGDFEDSHGPNMGWRPAPVKAPNGGSGRGRHPKGLLVISAPLRKRPLGAAFADHRSRQQYRPGAEGAEKEDAA